MKVFFLGTGTSQGVPVLGCSCDTCASSDPRNTRFRTHIHVEIGGFNIQVDAAPEFRIQALRHAIPKIDWVILTHGHSDHILGMDDLRRFCDFREGKALPVYTNADGDERLRSIFGYAVRERSKVPGYPAFSPRAMPRVLEFADGAIHSFNQSHGDFETLGLVFTEKRSQRKFAYFTDCDSVSPEAIDQARGAEALVLDALREKPHRSHMSIEEATAVAKEIGAANCYLIHMTHEIEHERTEKKLPATVRLAYDNLILEI